MNRRQFAAALAALAVAAAPPRRGLMTLGFSTYGMPGWPAEKALAAVAAAGFDTAELCVLPAYDSAPGKLTAARRAGVRRQLDGSGLGLPALMESLTPTADDRQDRQMRDRLKRAAALAGDLCPRRPPLVETVLGGGEWEKVRFLYRDRLGRWAEDAAAARVVLAIKPHRFGAMSLPKHANWLIRQVGSSWLRMVYDQSHYEGRGLVLADLMREAASHTAFVAVKDVTFAGGKATFELPGAAGRPDHAAVVGALAAAGYRGDVSCEVSGMVSSRKGYDAGAAVRACFEKMGRIMRSAGAR